MTGLRENWNGKDFEKEGVDEQTIGRLHYRCFPFLPL